MINIPMLDQQRTLSNFELSLILTSSNSVGSLATISVLLELWGGGTGGQEPGRIGGEAGGVLEAGEERAGSGSSKRVGSRREIRNDNFFNSTMR